MDPEKRRDLVTWMKDHMAQIDLAAKDVAERMGMTTNSMVSQVLRRDRKIPVDDAGKWAVAFKVDQKDIPHFRLLVELMWATDSIRRDYWEQRDRIASMEEKVKNALDRAAAQAERIKALEEERAALPKRRSGG